MFTRDVLKTFETEDWRVIHPNETNVAYYTKLTHPEDRIDVRWQDQRPKHDVLTVRPMSLNDDTILQSLRLAEKFRTYVTELSSHRLLYVTGEKTFVLKGMSSKDPSPEAFQRVCSETYLDEIEDEMKRFLHLIEDHSYEPQQKRFIEDHPDAIRILEGVFLPRVALIGEKSRKLAEWFETNGYAHIIHSKNRGETLLHLTIADGEHVIHNYLRYYEVVRFFRLKGYILDHGREVITSHRRLLTRRTR